MYVPFVHVLDSSGRPVRYLYRRGGQLYMRVTVRRKTYLRAVPAASVQEAVRWVRRFVADARLAEPARLRAVVAAPRAASVGDVCDAYLVAAARFGVPSRSSAALNVARLLAVVRDGLPSAAPRGESVGVLSAALVERWAEGWLGVAPDDSRRRSCRSYLRQARSVFARAIVRAGAFRGLALPDLREFLEAVPCGDPAVQYRMPAAEFIEPFMARAHVLGECRPGLFGAFLLLFYAGARPGDAVAARWSWLIEEELAPGVRRWVIDFGAKPEEGYRPKASGGLVPLPAAAVAALRALERPGDPFILAGGSETGRRDLICRELATWMRAEGWGTRMAGYELRKLRGCYWRLKYGMDRCHKWMRHRDYNTTLRHYADLPRRPLPSDLEVGRELDPFGGPGL